MQCSSGHPLHHAAMVVIAAIAERDRRLWPERDDDASLLQADPPTSAEGDQPAPVGAGALRMITVLTWTAQTALHPTGVLPCPQAARERNVIVALPESTAGPPMTTVMATYSCLNCNVVQRAA